MPDKKKKRPINWKEERDPNGIDVNGIHEGDHHDHDVQLLPKDLQEWQKQLSEKPSHGMKKAVELGLLPPQDWTQSDGGDKVPVSKIPNLDGQ